MKPEYAIEYQNKALAMFARQDGIQADTAQVVRYEGRYAGNYVIVRKGDEVVAVYKTVFRTGPAKATRTESGGVAYVVDSFSIGLKRIKRAPKDLLEQGRPVTA